MSIEPQLTIEEYYTLCVQAGATLAYGPTKNTEDELFHRGALYLYCLNLVTPTKNLMNIEYF